MTIISRGLRHRTRPVGRRSVNLTFEAANTETEPKSILKIAAAQPLLFAITGWCTPASGRPYAVINLLHDRCGSQQNTKAR